MIYEYNTVIVNNFYLNKIINMLNVEDLGYVAKEALFGNEETRVKLIEIKKDMLKDFIETIKNNKPDIKDL